jgi:AcrR family transcriptional regulator
MRAFARIDYSHSPPAMKTVLAPRKLPRQARSQATVDAILDATAQVLLERGYAGTSTNLVAERAGVSVGSLYQYFPNKDALLAALHEQHVRQQLHAIEHVLKRHEGDTLEAALSAVVEAVVEAHRGIEAELHRALHDEFFDHEQDRDDEIEQKFGDLVRRLLAAHRDRITVPDLKLAAFMLMNSLHPLVHAAVLERPAGLSLKAFNREMVQLALAYLTAPR